MAGVVSGVMRWRGIAGLALLVAPWCVSSRASAQEVNLTFVGDIMLDGLPGERIAQGFDPFSRVASELGQADLATGNLECAVATIGEPLEKPFTFRAHPRVVPILASHFAALTLANNHTGDYGKPALLETLAHLEASNVGVFGAGRDLVSAHRALLLERRGLRIALLGYDEFQPRVFEAGFDTPGVAWSEDEQVISDMRAARAAGADLVIPFFHWGWEKEHAACARQQALAHKLIDAGADAIIGAHPHVTQGVELYRSKLIVYSLGNFVFDGFEDEDTTTGWLVTLRLGKSGLSAWRTSVVRLDSVGFPSPDPSAVSPCGDALHQHSCRAGRYLD